VVEAPPEELGYSALLERGAQALSNRTHLYAGHHTWHLDAAGKLVSVVARQARLNFGRVVHRRVIR